MSTGYIGQGAAAAYNNTWGHLAPKKDIEYKGKVRITFTGHSQYGCQAIILDYCIWCEGPYFHDALFEAVTDKVKNYSDYSCKNKTKFHSGIWDIPLSFKNYKIKFDFKNSNKIADSLTPPQP